MKAVVQRYVSKALVLATLYQLGPDNDLADRVSALRAEGVVQAQALDDGLAFLRHVAGVLAFAVHAEEGLGAHAFQAGGPASVQRRLEALQAVVAALRSVADDGLGPDQLTTENDG